MSRERTGQGSSLGDRELRQIITDAESAELLVSCAQDLGRSLKQAGLTTSQIRALFGEVRQIQGEWSVSGRRDHARRKLILLKPKMAYRARRERGRAVEMLVNVLDPAVDLVVRAPVEGSASTPGNNQDDNFERFVEFFEAILAYHKAYGGN